MLGSQRKCSSSPQTLLQHSLRRGLFRVKLERQGAGQAQRRTAGSTTMEIVPVQISLAQWLRRLDFVPGWAGWAIGLSVGILAGAALGGVNPWIVGGLGFLGVLGIGAALAWSGEPVALVDTKSHRPTDASQSVPKAATFYGGGEAAPLRLGADRFVVWIAPGRDGARQVLASSPWGQSVNSFSFPWSPDEWLAISTELATTGRLSTVKPEGPVPGGHQEIGEALFQALFCGEMRKLWVRSLDRASSRNRILHLCLRLEDQEGRPPLDSLPWELLCQMDTLGFLALSRLTPISRSVMGPSPSPPPSPRVMRILIVVSDLFSHGHLNLEREQREILTTLGNLPKIEVIFLGRPRLEDLRQALLQQEIHILHFMGHADAEGLFFERDGAPYLVSGPELATILAEITTLRLVFLNSSETARAPGGLRFHSPASVAAHLVNQGVPAVIGMQFSISDEAAILFSGTVYRSLAKGDFLDTAVTEGRQAILWNSPVAMDWASPVLITRGYPVRLFARRPGANLNRWALFKGPRDRWSRIFGRNQL